MDQPAAMHTVSLYAFRFLLLALTAGPLAANEIRLEARFEKSEHSMDSNSTKETYKVSGPTLRYSYEYSGYHPDPGFERETTLRAWVDNAKTEKLLREKGLLKNLTREFPLKKDQPGRREILLELTIQTGSGKYVLRFHGAPGPEMDADPDFKNAQEVLASLRAIAASEQ